MKYSFLVFVFLIAFGSAKANSTLVPKYFPSFWNDNDETLWENNCYNYSTNRVTNSFAQPGEASGKMYEEINCEAVIEAASNDLGLIKSEYFPYSSKDDDTLIALVVSPDYDYHWYRRGEDGLWTHKMGGTPATNLDSSGNIIKDVTTADRGSYVDFCGYFRVKNYPENDHEQDGGYVRIGNMSKLPGDKSKSTIEIQMYSGRRNPRMTLEEALSNPVLRKQLILASENVLEGTYPVVDEVPTFRELDGKTIILHDREGILFDEGTTVKIRSGVSKIISN
ncbi:MAG: hypothetical protein KDD25_00875 [Bdellovibrionales bacterium]|nr:hypothetical protein [Bdellovibrionales bacterium]